MRRLAADEVDPALSLREVVEYIPNRRELVNNLVSIVRPGDLLITQGAGDVTQIGPLFIEAMREREAKE